MKRIAETKEVVERALVDFHNSVLSIINPVPAAEP